jgi:ATP-dependent DNA helicase
MTGEFKAPASASSRGKQETMTELAASLLKLEGKKIEVVPNSEAGKAKIISDEDLNMLLDRSPEVFADRGKGWASKDGEEKEQAAFKVYDGQVDEGNDALARVMGESEEC